MLLLYHNSDHTFNYTTSHFTMFPTTSQFLSYQHTPMPSWLGVCVTTCLPRYPTHPDQGTLPLSSCSSSTSAAWLSHLLLHNLQPQPLNHFTIPKPLVMPLRSLNVVPGTHPAGWRNTRVLHHKGSQPSLTSSRPSSPPFFHLLLLYQPLTNPPTQAHLSGTTTDAGDSLDLQTTCLS